MKQPRTSFLLNIIHSFDDDLLAWLEGGQTYECNMSFSLAFYAKVLTKVRTARTAERISQKAASTAARCLWGSLGRRNKPILFVATHSSSVPIYHTIQHDDRLSSLDLREPTSATLASTLATRRALCRWFASWHGTLAVHGGKQRVGINSSCRRGVQGPESCLGCLVRGVSAV